MTKRSLGTFIGLLIVTVILLIIFNIWNNSFHVQERDPPDGDGISGIYGNDHVVKITMFSPAIPPQYVKVQLIDVNGSKVYEIPMEVTYCANYTFVGDDGRPITEIVYYDMNQDGKVTAGDRLVIRGDSNTDVVDNKGRKIPGPGSDGLTFKMICKRSKAKIMEVPLNESGPLMNMTDANWSFDVESWFSNGEINLTGMGPALSRWKTMGDVPVYVEVDIRNDHNSSVGNITIELFMVEKTRVDREYVDDEPILLGINRTDHIQPNGSYNCRFNATSTQPNWWGRFMLEVTTPDLEGSLITTKEFNAHPFKYTC